MSYVTIYRALLQPTQAETLVARGGDYGVYLHPGPFDINYSTGSPDPLAPQNTMNLGQASRHFPKGSYIIVLVMPSQVPSGTSPIGWAAAGIRFAQAVAALDLEFPGIVGERLYEGTMQTQSEPFFLSWEEGYRFTANTGYRPSAVATALQARLDQLHALPAEVLDRFTLAARWFRRANDSTNSIDRVLFYYTVLEVYPTLGSADVPNCVSDFLVENVYPTFTRQQIKEKLDLGRICGFRAEIVHDGKANVDQGETVRVMEYVARLQAVSRTCLRVLAQLPPGSDLDRFVR